MAAKQVTLTPRYCIQHSRHSKQDGWLLWDISVQLSGNIAVTSSNVNTYQTSIDVYSVRNSDSRDKPKMIYSKQFEKYSDEKWIYLAPHVSFIDDDVLVSCHGYKLELFQVSKDEVLRSRRVNGYARCLSVREREIFIGFDQSNKITVYDVIDLNEIKSIILQGIQDGYCPYDMTAKADRIFVCVSDGKEGSVRRSLIFEEKNGRILSELTKPTDTHLYAGSISVCVTLGVLVVIWCDSFTYKEGMHRQIVFYSLFSENNSSFLIVEMESGVCRIRISDRGDRMVTGNKLTGEVKVYDMAEFFTYSHFKEKLVSTLQTDDCTSLANFFNITKNQTDAILSSDTPSENLLLVLEEKGVLHPYNVDRLTKALHELKIHPLCFHVAEIYQKTRAQSTSYGRFLATLSAHLTASLPGDLCDYFNISDEKKNSITSSQDPGLSLLLALDEMGIINLAEVGALEQPFTEKQLVQAVAKIHEYQSIVEEEKSQFMKEIDLTRKDKLDLFVKCLQSKIISWYETMTPVPWKKSCRWRSSDLFVGSGLILTDSKANDNTVDIDPQCKLEYQDVLTHDKLKSESRLILEGEPGCGKTMLSSQLAYDWAQGKVKNTSILVLLPLKFVEGMTLDAAIKQFYVPEHTPLTEEDIVSILQRDDLSTVILLDGLEEYNSPLTGTESTPSEVHQVMSKVKYPNCKVVLTSRSDYAHDLPACPMLKLGKFSDTERNIYINKLFADDERKQQEIKKIIEDTPFILDLCSVPLLFVLAVHNVDSIPKSQLDRVTPFMDGMVETLCPPVSYKDRTDTLTFEEYNPEGFSIDKFAFNGLCKGFQQLSWSKTFMENYIDNIKEWTDSGVLVIEEGIAVVKRDRIDGLLPEEAMETAKETTESGQDDAPSTSGLVPVRKSAANAEKYENQTTFERKSQTEAGSSSFSELVSLEPSNSSEKRQQSSSGSTAKHFPLQLKFLHKVFQEWFAAKYLSSVIWFKSKNSFSEQLSMIDPSDLHYVLRFTCYLCPPSCHIVLNHLLKSYRDNKGTIPKHIMDCICLCYAEYVGYVGEDIKLVVSEICKETITIQSKDSRLLQQSKISILRSASQSGIPIFKVQLLDVVTAVGDEVLTFNSGVTMDTLDTLQVIEISRWDESLEKDYSHLLKSVTTTKCVKNVCLSFPSQPPGLQQEILEEIASKNITVHWNFGHVEYTLDPLQKIWRLFTYSHFKEELVSILQTDDCTRLADFFKIPKDQTGTILSSDTPSENLFLALEEKGVLQPYNVDRLTEAFHELKMNPFLCHVAEIYQKIIVQQSSQAEAILSLPGPSGAPIRTPLSKSAAKRTHLEGDHSDSDNGCHGKRTKASKMASGTTFPMGSTDHAIGENSNSNLNHLITQIHQEPSLFPLMEGYTNPNHSNINIRSPVTPVMMSTMPRMSMQLETLASPMVARPNVSHQSSIDTNGLEMSGLQVSSLGTQQTSQVMSSLGTQQTGQVMSSLGTQQTGQVMSSLGTQQTGQVMSSLGTQQTSQVMSTPCSVREVQTSIQSLGPSTAQPGYMDVTSQHHQTISQPRQSIIPQAQTQSGYCFPVFRQHMQPLPLQPIGQLTTPQREEFAEQNVAAPQHQQNVRWKGQFISQNLRQNAGQQEIQHVAQSFPPAMTQPVSLNTEHNTDDIGSTTMPQNPRQAGPMRNENVEQRRAQQNIHQTIQLEQPNNLSLGRQATVCSVEQQLSTTEPRTTCNINQTHRTESESVATTSQGISEEINTAVECCFQKVVTPLLKDINDKLGHLFGSSSTPGSWQDIPGTSSQSDNNVSDSAALYARNLPDSEPDQEVISAWESLSEDDRMSLQAFRGMTDDRAELVRRLVEMVFTEEERHNRNCFGKSGKQKLDANKLRKIRHITFYLCPIKTKKTDIDKLNLEDVEWKRLCEVIDKSNRHFREKQKRQENRR